MGTAEEHRKKAEHNRDFLGTIGDPYPDWLATVAFYEAVQWVEQLLAKRGIHSVSHHDRNHRVRQDFPALRHAFKALYNASLIARYDPPQAALPTHSVLYILIAKHLTSVRTFTAAQS